MDLRKRIFLKIFLPIFSVILVLIIAFIFMRKKPESAEEPIVEETETVATSTETQNLVSSELPSLPVNNNTTMISTEQNPSTLAKQISRMFVERFASYSNQNENEHIKDAIALSTPTMQKWLEAQSEIRLNGEDYTGVTTKVISSSVRQISATAATIEVEVIQTIFESQEETTNQKTGRVELVSSVGDGWKVNAFYWE